jgi:hypothetical protein
LPTKFGAQLDTQVQELFSWMVWVFNYLQGPCIHIVGGEHGLHEPFFPVTVALVVRELVFGAILCDPGLAFVVDYLLQSFCG